MQGDGFMIFNLMAMFEDAGEASGGMSLGVLVGLIVGGSLIFAGIILGIVLKAIEASRKSRKAKAKHAQKQSKTEEAPAPVVVEEKYYDYTNLSEEEKALIRKHRDGLK